MAELERAFVEGMFARHRAALQAFFYRRIRTKSDAADLAQEVCLRLLRVADTEAIRNPAIRPPPPHADPDHARCRGSLNSRNGSVIP
jgi:hypothetical protein